MAVPVDAEAAPEGGFLELALLPVPPLSPFFFFFGLALSDAGTAAPAAAAALSAGVTISVTAGAGDPSKGVFVPQLLIPPAGPDRFSPVAEYRTGPPGPF